MGPAIARFARALAVVLLACSLVPLRLLRRLWRDTHLET